jgi:two-component sensor histidine kinase
LHQARGRIADLQHIIRDTSQIALGVVSIVASRHETADAKLVARDVRLRLGAIGIAVAHSEDGVVEISTCIGRLARETASLFARQGIGQRLELDSVRVPERAAVSIALVAVELLTNAYQHAFAERPFGSVEVKLAPKAEHWATLRVTDNGAGLRSDIAANWPHVLPGGRYSGLSSAIGLARMLGGQLHLVCHGGSAFELSFPTA